MFSKALSCCGPLAFAAALVHPGVSRAQFRLPPAGTAPPGYRSSTLPPRYGSSTLPPVPRYGMPYHPQTFQPTAPPQQEARDEVRTPGRDTAVITAHVPKDAELRFDRVKVIGTGEVRQFKSPPLQPGHSWSASGCQSVPRARSLIRKAPHGPLSLTSRRSTLGLSLSPTTA